MLQTSPVNTRGVQN